MHQILEAIRTNHALEHATITLLLREMGSRLRVVGQAAPDGFFLYGDLPTDRIAAAAEEALGRLQQGEADLAVSPFCGTNLAVAGLLAALATAISLGGRFRWDRLPQAIFAATAAVVLAQPLGRLVQRHVTTSPLLEGVRIRGIRRLLSGPVPVHKVVTTQQR